MKKETYCLACRKYTKNNNPKVVRNKQNRLMIQSNCATCDSKKSRFIKKQQAMGILSNLGIKTPLSKVPLLNILVLIYFKKMNNIINKFLLAGDKFMPEMHLRQPRFVYSACGPFTRRKERIKEFKRTGDMGYIYRNELDKACFQHDSAYADHKDLINRTEADKVLKGKAYDIASNPEYDGYQRGLASMVYKFFDKKSLGSGFKKLKKYNKVFNIS